MYYIHAIASISHQDSFKNPNLFDSLKKLESDSEAFSPNYKDYIPPASLRRLSPVLRMGLTASIECKSIVEKDFDAISVGTALGCLRDTEKFLTTILTTTSDFLSPTAFIQSTHNTIGGQISLGLKNHAYNMTHTQNNLSFEVALLDAMLSVDEGKQNVLVGAADEYIPFLNLLQPTLIPEGRQLTSGASFFAISNNIQESSIGILDVRVNFNAKNVQGEIDAFLQKHSLTTKDIALVLTDGTSEISFMETIETINYLDYSGVHYSASAFALHIGHDYLKNNTGSHALIVNQLCPGKLGLTLLKKG